MEHIGPDAKTAIPVLAELLKDKDVRVAAAYALGGIGPDAKIAIPVLTELLKDKNVRVAAASALGGIGPDAKTAIPALTELLKNKDFNVRVTRETAARALGEIGPDAKTAIPALTELLKDEDSYVRFAAASALGEISPESKTAISALTELLKDKDSHLRLAAASALERISPESKTAILALTELLKDEDSYWRQAAAEALGDIGPEAKAAVSALIQSLTDNHWPVRHKATEALGKIRPDAKTAVPPLTELLKHKDWSIRMYAADALGYLGPDAKTAVPAITELLKDNDEDVYAAAAEALEKIKNEKKQGSGTSKHRSDRTGCPTTPVRRAVSRSPVATNWATRWRHQAEISLVKCISLLRALGLIVICASILLYRGWFVPIAARIVLDETINVDGAVRHYRLVIPNRLPQERVPIVFAFHGIGDSTTEEMAAYSDLDRLAAENGFILVYPVARNHMWATMNIDPKNLDRNPDVRFFDQLLGHLGERFRLNPNGVYLVGMSNGASFAQLVAFVRENVAAVVTRRKAHRAYGSNTSFSHSALGWRGRLRSEWDSIRRRAIPQGWTRSGTDRSFRFGPPMVYRPQSEDVGLSFRTHIDRQTAHPTPPAR